MPARKKPPTKRTQQVSEPAEKSDAIVPLPPDDPAQGRSGEGAHSAMKHWHEQERKRVDKPDQ